MMYMVNFKLTEIFALMYKNSNNVKLLASIWHWKFFLSQKSQITVTGKIDVKIFKAVRITCWKYMLLASITFI